MIRFAICDDEPFMLDIVSAYISSYMKGKRDAFLINRFSTGRELLEYKGVFDILLLDIQMEEPNGMETAKLLREKGFRGLLIFLTVLKECVFDSFEVEAYDYLVKPLEEQRFRRTMDRAVRSLRQSEKSIVIQRGSDCKIIPLSQIVYCEVLGRKLYLHDREGEITDYYDKMEHFEKQTDNRFFRCHRSYLINLDYVRGYSKGLAILSENSQIPVSRLRERELMQALLRHMKER